MTSSTAEKLAEVLGSAQTAISNAKMRSRLRGEHVELVIAGERVDEGLAILHSITENPGAAESPAG